MQLTASWGLGRGREREDGGTGGLRTGAWGGGLQTKRQGEGL